MHQIELPYLHILFMTLLFRFSNYTHTHTADSTCRLETKEFFLKDNVTPQQSQLSKCVNGVPESLILWLADIRVKMLGTDGHREKVLFIYYAIIYLI